MNNIEEMVTDSPHTEYIERTITFYLTASNPDIYRDHDVSITLYSIETPNGLIITDDENYFNEDDSQIQEDQVIDEINYLSTDINPLFSTFLREFEQAFSDMTLTSDCNSVEQTNTKLNNYKIYEYDKDIFSKQDATCTICFDDFVEKDEIVFLHCDHIFHNKCLEEAIKYKTTCPICRDEISTITFD